jgi:site-specific recombinase XerD
MIPQLQSFLTAKMAAGLAPRTLDWYRAFITAWLVTCPTVTASASQIETYLAGLRRKGMAPATVAGHYRALSVWFAWLVESGAIGASPMRTVRRPKAPQKRVAYVTPAELRALVAGIDGDNWLDARDRAFVLLLFYSGVRVSESIALHTTEVEFAKRLLFVRRGKGGLPRLIPFAAEVAPALLDYLYRRPPSPLPQLWLAQDGNYEARGALTDNGARQMLRRRCKEAGIRYLNPHAFRHGFAMWTLNAGMELSAVAAAMGHSSTQVTQRTYARWLPDSLQREYEDAATRLRKGHTR